MGANIARSGSAKRWRLLGWGAGAALILLPLVAMAVTQEVDWSPFDFAFAAALVIGVGLAVELAVRMTPNRSYRSGVAVALGAAFLLIWINGAVGIIGSEDNAANTMFFGVLAVALIGAAVGRFRPRGMMWAMTAAAAAQVLVMVAALVGGFGFIGPITVFFAALWLASTALFRKAAREQAGTVS